MDKSLHGCWWWTCRWPVMRLVSASDRPFTIKDISIPLSAGSASSMNCFQTTPLIGVQELGCFFHWLNPSSGTLHNSYFQMSDRKLTFHSLGLRSPIDRLRQRSTYRQKGNTDRCLITSMPSILPWINLSRSPTLIRKVTKKSGNRERCRKLSLWKRPVISSYGRTLSYTV